MKSLLILLATVGSAIVPSLSRKQSRFFCVAVLLVLAASQPETVSAQGGPPFGVPAVAANVRELLQQIDDKHPESIKTDSTGHVVSLALPQGWANDNNLRLVSRIDSLQLLELAPTRRAEPTQLGIVSLARRTNLVSLNLVCSGPLPEGVLRSVCSLNRLRSLSLAADYPPVSEYDSITNLQNLTELHVNCCTNFGDAQLTLITNLPNLRSLELRADALSSQATNVLFGMKTLTNLVIEPSGRL